MFVILVPEDDHSGSPEQKNERKFSLSGYRGKIYKS